MTARLPSPSRPVVASLADAVAQNVRPGDTIQVMLGHSRWTALAREVARQFWRRDPGFTLVMTSLGALGAMFFRGGLVRKVVTTYSGNSFPTYSPNPIFRRAYESGEVEVEHWSILTLSQRLEAAARGLPATVTGSLVGSSMAENDAFRVVDSPFGSLGLLEPLAPDVTLLHAAASDPHGNLVISEPLLDGVWGAWAARRGVVATVERVVDDLEGLGHRVRVPAHRVLAVVEAPYGAHPGGCYAPGLPVRSYGEDIAHWNAVADAAAMDEFDDYVEDWVLGPVTHEDYLSRVGSEQLLWLEGRSDPMSWKADADDHPIVEDPTVTVWECAAALGAREVERLVADVEADAVLAGAGVANLSAWVAVARARGGRQSGGSDRGARPVGVRADAGRPVHLQPPCLSRDAIPVGRVRDLGHGDRGARYAHDRLPRCGRGRPQRVPQLDGTGRREVPGRFGRRQRRGQPVHGVRGGDVGSSGETPRLRRLRDLTGTARGERRDR